MYGKIMDGIILQLERCAIVPVVKLEDVSKAEKLAKALRDGGINCVEITFRANGADKAIRDILKAYPDMTVGAGTVLTVSQAESAIKAGAKFLVAPGFNPAVVRYSVEKGVPFIPGVSSPSEIEQAIELGLKHVKFFPAEQAGGLAYIKAVSAPYPDIRFMPTGGINENNISDYLLYDKIFACGGSWMAAPELIEAERWADITALSKSAINKILGFDLAHIGINCGDEKQALSVAGLFNLAFGFEKKAGSSSIFSSNGIEIMKTKALGAMGHIAIKTNSVCCAMRCLEAQGFELDEKASKYDDKGKPVAVYLKQDFGGFAVHIMQKK